MKWGQWETGGKAWEKPVSPLGAETKDSFSFRIGQTNSPCFWGFFFEVLMSGFDSFVFGGERSVEVWFQTGRESWALIAVYSNGLFSFRLMFWTAFCVDFRLVVPNLSMSKEHWIRNTTINETMNLGTPPLINRPSDSIFVCAKFM